MFRTFLKEDLQRRLHQEENSWWANDPELANWFWPDICFDSWYRWGFQLILTQYRLQLLISVKIATPHDWVSNPRSIFLEWMFFHSISCTVHLESTGGALPLKSTGKPLPVNPLARKGVLSHTIACLSHVISVCFFAPFPVLYTGSARWLYFQKKFAIIVAPLCVNNCPARFI